ncbi:hypothetical protein LY76DRAFT_156613 [Colletotrichum caudatum]|nr:hypothetical protein LY76DRAFT_156613 [Colletotrichum caudatum]
MPCPSPIQMTGVRGQQSKAPCSRSWAGFQVHRPGVKRAMPRLCANPALASKAKRPARMT